ncbi:response regulator [Paraburkholderia lacunae]|uniref:DNA-binding response regulator n=1 Tax=Paraburkholderia lacunae TaxID=2211104 RepID=A0A370NFA9_9BURK|nr:response regulator [Paraburkholderia lacunae]RDK04261.1 DNA-binding response regulator [Paraburkholderia lacunae]
MGDFSIRVMIADDHPVTGHGIAQALTGVPAIEVVGVVANSQVLVEKLDAVQCDVLVLDYVMPGDQYGDGQTLLTFLQRRYPHLRMVTVTMISAPDVFRALQKLGVTCILSKSDSMSHLVTAVHAAYTNGRYLSPTIVQLLESNDVRGKSELSAREAEIVRLFRAGYRVGEIAEQLHRSKKTVSAQKLAAMRKLGITRDADLIKYDGSLALSVKSDAATDD